MVLSYNEIKDRALKFSKEWAGTTNEIAEAQSFLIDFFNVLGINRRKVASFEYPVKKLDNHDGRIDLIWKGIIIVEMKSRGQDLEKAYKQARDYLPGLNDYELPKYILVCDFENFHLYDLDEGKKTQFKLLELVKNVHHFGHLIGYQKKEYKEQDPVNIKAAELMGKLHDSLKEIGYSGHPLEVYLVRLLFCLFAEDTTIFNKQQFQDYIEQRTNVDGSDLAARLQELFQVLNTPQDKRFRNLDEQLMEFPYVNGKLFEEILPIACFDSKMRRALLSCCSIEWSKISPAIFGSMFQSVMNPVERRNLGAHYTSEKNILKLIKPLFLDDLWKEFISIKGNKNKLNDFHKKLRSLKFLDPACGCGNFLVITYRELRMLELEILRALNKTGQRFINVNDIIWLDVDQFFGIEYEEFPARIAEVAMWLVDHQMNMLVSQEFGEYYIRLPLKKAAKIVHGNALRISWNQLILEDNPIRPYACFNYILGNPPFVGKQQQSSEQKRDMELVFQQVKSAGVLDYVSSWYIKAAQYLEDFNSDKIRIKVAFVSTNSIAQGEQVGILWKYLQERYRIKIHFAHRTFKWSNEASGKAGVHVVIIGFSNYDTLKKWIFEYADVKGEPHEILAKNINPYLIDAKDNFIISRNTSICSAPEINFGSMPNDGGNLLFSKDEMLDFIKTEPESKPYFRRILGAEELLNGVERYCLWMKDSSPKDLTALIHVKNRIQKVKEYRLCSTRKATQKLASFPFLFGEIRQPSTHYIAIPEVSSERRKYIPISFIKKDIIASNRLKIIPNATLYHLGILSSLMHMTWTKHICGRLESRITYSNNVVYNNFPWPESPSEKHYKAIEFASQKILDTRAVFTDSSLADLYDPLTMPPALVKAHNDLDRAVDQAYRPQPFPSEANRMEFLFMLYEKYTGGLFPNGKLVRSKKKKESGTQGNYS